MTDAHGRPKEFDMSEIRPRIVALQRSAANLAQLDVEELATFLPAGTSREQLIEIKTKLVQLHNLQNRRNERNNKSVDGDGDGAATLAIEGANGRSSRYKTELCRPYEENGVCKYGARCQFAHGTGELRNLTRHPKYKSQLCRTFHSNGLCPYGHRCHFIHNQEEIRAVLPATQVSIPMSSGSIDAATECNTKGHIGGGGGGGGGGVADAYPDLAFNSWNRRNSLSQLYVDGMSSLQNSLLQRVIARPTSICAGGLPAPCGPLTFGTFKSMSTGCSLGSADELSPPISPIVYSPDDPFTPQNFARHSYFPSGVLADASLPSDAAHVVSNLPTPEAECAVGSASGSTSPLSPENSAMNTRQTSQMPFWWKGE